MRVNADSLLIGAATTSTSGTLNDLTTDLIMANNNNSNLSLVRIRLNSCLFCSNVRIHPELSPLWFRIDCDI